MTTLARDIAYTLISDWKLTMCTWWENTAPDTEFARYFCAGIGPLQLGFVLVTIIISLDVFLVTKQKHTYIAQLLSVVYLALIVSYPDSPLDTPSP